MAPSVSVNFIPLVTSCVRLRKEEPQTAFHMSFIWAPYIAQDVKLYPIVIKWISRINWEDWGPANTPML